MKREAARGFSYRQTLRSALKKRGQLRVGKSPESLSGAFGLRHGAVLAIPRDVPASHRAHSIVAESTGGKRTNEEGTARVKRRTAIAYESPLPQALRIAADSSEKSEPFRT